MVIRTFEGQDMNEALKKVRKELGSEAVILGSRTRRPASGRTENVVVTAGLPGIDPPWIQEPSFSSGSGQGESGGWPQDASQIRRELDMLRETVLQFERDWGPRTRESVLELIRHIESLGTGTLSGETDALPRTVPSPAETLLKEAGIDDGSAQSLVEGLRTLSYSPSDLEDASRVHSLLQFLIARNIRVGGSFLEQAKEGEVFVCLLTGPTGVGKTTTAAKLAAGFTLKHKKRVRLVNLDTFRIGALEQLKIYGDLMGLPVEVASTPERFVSLVSEARRRNADDILLVDTAGLSFGDMGKLRPYVDALNACGSPPIHVSLVLSAGAKTEDLSGAVERFRILSPSSLILTKVDETSALGSVYPFLSRSTLPVSYVTTGQKVPDDIEVAHAGKLSQWILGGFR
jgi:flagellar biosynthesis protein FlhF